MSKSHAAPAARSRPHNEPAPLGGDAPAADPDGVAQRRERLAAYAKATRAVVVYRFVFPPDAAPGGSGGYGPRQARDRLYAIVGVTGGGVTRSHRGLAARIPKTAAARFEGLARSLIEAYLVSIDLGDTGSSGSSIRSKTLSRRRGRAIAAPVQGGG